VETVGAVLMVVVMAVATAEEKEAVLEGQQVEAMVAGLVASVAAEVKLEVARVVVKAEAVKGLEGMVVAMVAGGRVGERVGTGAV
jgi:hypothetical protein